MKKVLLGLSGGVDSAVAGMKLIKDGYDVTGCFLLLTETAEENSEEAKNAQRVADFLGIELVKADFRERFKKNVSEYFINEYLAGRTPNPCVRCNPTVKCRSLADVADSLGIEEIATGHYAISGKSEKYGGNVIRMAPSKKDQSYFLCRLPYKLAGRIIFPLGEYSSKEEVRAAAADFALPNANKADSQEICFIPDNNYQRYICENSDFVPKSGSFIDIHGNVIGTHTGIINYTVGQRKGLGAFGEPRYVKEINAYDNTVTLCTSEERFADELEGCDISLAVKRLPENEFRGKVKIRSTAPAADAIIRIIDDKIRVQFESKVTAPTPGQSAAFYDGDILLGGAIIL